MIDPLREVEKAIAQCYQAQKALEASGRPSYAMGIGLMQSATEQARRARIAIMHANSSGVTPKAEE